MTLKNLRLEFKRLSISAGQKLAMCGIVLVPAPDCSSPRISYLLIFLYLAFFRGSVLGQDTSEPSLVLVKPRKA